MTQPLMILKPWTVCHDGTVNLFDFYLKEAGSRSLNFEHASSYLFSQLVREAIADRAAVEVDTADMRYVYQNRRKMAVRQLADEDRLDRPVLLSTPEGREHARKALGLLALEIMAADCWHKKVAIRYVLGVFQLEPGGEPFVAQAFCFDGEKIDFFAETGFLYPGVRFWSTKGTVAEVLA